MLWQFNFFIFSSQVGIQLPVDGLSKAQALAGRSCRCNGLVHSAVFPTRCSSAVALPPAASVLMEFQLVQAWSKPHGSLQRFLVGEVCVTPNML